MSHAFARSFVAVVGIDRYRGGIPALDNAVRDAETLATLLCRDHGYSALRLTRRATAARVDKLFRVLTRRVGPEDRLIFYFAGHGIAPGSENPGALLCEDAERLGEERGILRMDALRERLDRLRCRHLLVILDCCYAGSFRWAGTTRNAEILPPILYREHYLRFVEDRAAQVLTSSAHDQRAHDSLGSRGGARHSPFAAALLEALAGGADIMPPGGDGVITATELFVYLRDRVELITLAEGLRQTPELCQLENHDKGEFVFEVPGRLADLLPAPPLAEELNPYARLLPVRDSGLLFGRVALVKKVAEAVARNRLTLLTGPPLSGKSSVLEAGVLPALGKDWRIVGPFGAREGLVVLQAPAEPGAQEVVAVDAMEELLRLPEAEQTAWSEALTCFLLAGDSGRHLLLVLRAGDEEPLRRLLGLDDGLWRGSRIEVPALDYEARRQTIFGPARQRALFVADDLADRLLEDAGTGDGASALLGLALHAVYVRALKSGRNDRRLVREDYEELGGLAELVRAEVAPLESSLAAELRPCLHRLIFRMTDIRGKDLVGRSVPAAELDSSDPAENEAIRLCLDRLAAASLVVPEGDGFAPIHAEVPRAFESLGAWPTKEREKRRSLQRWVAATTAHWLAKERAPGVLTPKDPRLDELLQPATAAVLGLSASEKQFVFASQAARIAAEKRRRRRLLFGAILALAALALGTVAWILRDLSQVRHQAAEASARMVLEPEQGLAAAAATWTRLEELDSRSRTTGLGREFALARRETLRTLFANLTASPGYRGAIGQVTDSDGVLLAGSDDGRTVAISTCSPVPPLRSRIELWQWRSGRLEKADERWLDGRIQCLDVATGGDRLLAASRRYIATYEIGADGKVAGEHTLDLAATDFTELSCSSVRLEPGGGAFIGTSEGRIVHLAAASSTIEPWVDGLNGIVNDLMVDGPEAPLLAAVWKSDTTMQRVHRGRQEPALAFGSGSPVRAMAREAMGGRLVTGHEDGAVSVWSAGRYVAERRFSRDSAVALVETAKPGRFVVGTEAGELIAFDLPARISETKELHEVARVRLFRSVVTGLAATPDGGVVAIGPACPARLWQPGCGASLESVLARPNPFSLGLVIGAERLWTFDRTTVAQWQWTQLGWNGPLLVFQAAAELEGKAIIGAAAPASGFLALLPDYGATDRRPWLVSLAGQTTLQALPGSISGPTARATFSPSGDLLAVGPFDKRPTILVWSTANPLGAPRRLADAKAGPVNHLAFSPDATRLAVSELSGCIRVFDLGTGDNANLECTDGSPGPAAWDAVTGLLAVGWLDGHISVGVPGDTRPRRVLDTHRESILALGFDPTGRWLISTSSDGLLLIWDKATWQVVGSLPEAGGKGSFVRDLAMTPDGAWVSLLGQGGSLLSVWPLEPAVWAAEARRLSHPSVGSKAEARQ